MEGKQEAPDGRVIAIVNQKGGVAKTTTAINLAASLAIEGIPTLLIDVDPQANATAGIGVARDRSRKSLYDALVHSVGPASLLLPTAISALTILPASKDLIGANLELISMPRREYRLQEVVSSLVGRFRYILLDCPPALDLLTLNALVAANGLLVPMQAEYFALEGISELISTLDRVAAAFNPGLTLDGVLLTMYDDRTNLSQQVTQSLRGYFGDKLLKTTIPRNVRLAEAPSHGLPVALYDPKSRGAEAYRSLARELLSQRINLETANPEKTTQARLQPAISARRNG